MTRRRYTQHVTSRGWHARFGLVDDYTLKVDEVKFVDDNPGLEDCQPFTVANFYLKGGKINRPFTSWFAPEFRNYLCDALHFHPVDQTGHLIPLDVPAYTELAVLAASRTTPNRPHVDVVENVLQMGELVSLIRNTSQQLVHRQAGRWNLEYQYGIAPIVSDLVSLLQFHDVVRHRIREIKKLYSAKGLRRTIKLGQLASYDTSSEWEQAMHWGDVYTTSICRGQTRIEFGAHCRWNTSVDFSSLDLPDLSALARKAVLGLTFDGLTAWNLFPWSWFVDWGIGIGNWFTINRNIIPCHLDGVFITEHAVSDYHYEGRSWEHDYAPVTLDPAQLHVETKKRIPTIPIPSARFPFLSGQQMGIVASLASVGRKGPTSFQWTPNMPRLTPKYGGIIHK